MDWLQSLVILMGTLLVLLSLGLPVAFAFLLLNIVGFLAFMGGMRALPQLVLSMYDSVSGFVFAPVPLFIFMGEIMFHSGLARRSMDALELWIGRLPGRLSVLSVVAGTLFASLTGSGMANTAMLGSTLVPEMQRRGYSKTMSMGPIMGSGALAIMIPPSSIGVLLGSLAGISVAGILIAGIIPGLLMALFYLFYVVGACWLNPALAPSYTVKQATLSEKVKSFAINIAPLSIIVFLVIGLILLGIATPTESAALGALGTLVLGIAYRELTWKGFMRALLATMKVTVMIFWVIACATGFSQLLAYTGGGPGLVQYVIGLGLSPMAVVLAMVGILLLLGCFMEQLAIMMLTIPLMMPVVQTLGLNPLWFGVLVLITMEIATLTPPFGLNLFVMKGAAPPDVSMFDVYRAATPFIICDLIVLTIMIAAPNLALWLPRLMER
ncbi:MAG TPA: TRAP transporter large permease subunit [Casimicrobiaceae bacterium]|nr:TRAP transporter large permease subunit [Casimicrobiaceae bacterium]